MFSNSLKEIYMLRKEINRLLSKEMLNIYSKVTTEETWHSQNFDFLSLISRSHFGELQLTKVSLNFKVSYCRGLGAKLSLAFLLF